MGTVLFLIIFVVVVGVVGGVMAATVPLKNQDGEIYDNFTTGNSFGSIGGNQAVKGVLKNNCLYIYSTYHPDVNVSLPYHKITNVEMTTDVTIIEKSKSVAGRAVIGGLILGPAGALFGGMSGIGTKQERIANNYILIRYKATPEAEEQGILLKYDIGATNKFVDTLRKKASVEDLKSVEL